jgi:hypothetical protein
MLLAVNACERRMRDSTFLSISHAICITMDTTWQGIVWKPEKDHVANRQAPVSFMDET